MSEDDGNGWELSDKEPLSGEVVDNPYGICPPELERAILDAVLVHGRAGDTLDDVAGSVQAGSVRLTVLAGRVRVSWGQRTKPADPASPVVLAGAWIDGEHIRRVIERWQSGQRVNGRTYE